MFDVLSVLSLSLDALLVVLLLVLLLVLIRDYFRGADEGWLYVSPKSKLPRRGTPQSVGIDLYPIHDYLIDAGKTVKIETGIIVRPPAGHFAMLVERSSLHKQGLNLANNVGIIDPDYCGPQDTIKVVLRNINGLATIVGRKDAIAQIIFVPYYIHDSGHGMPKLIDALDIPVKSRGGFGSTSENDAQQ